MPANLAAWMPRKRLLFNFISFFSPSVALLRSCFESPSASASRAVKRDRHASTAVVFLVVVVAGVHATALAIYCSFRVSKESLSRAPVPLHLLRPLGSQLSGFTQRRGTRSGYSYKSRKICRGAASADDSRRTGKQEARQCVSKRRE